LYLGCQFTIHQPTASATDATNDRQRMSSPGERKQVRAGNLPPGAHIFTRGRILWRTHHRRQPDNHGIFFPNIVTRFNRFAGRQDAARYGGRDGRPHTVGGTRRSG